MLRQVTDRVAFSIAIHPFKAAGAAGKYVLTFTMVETIDPKAVVGAMTLLYEEVFREMPIYLALMGLGEVQGGLANFGHINKAVGNKVLIPHPVTSEPMLGWDEYLLGLCFSDDEDMVGLACLYALGIGAISANRISHTVDSEDPCFPYIDEVSFKLATHGITEWDGVMAIPEPGDSQETEEVSDELSNAERQTLLQNLLPVLRDMIEEARSIKAQLDGMNNNANEEDKTV